jgi:DNA-binding CsgD family transcriptional regulator/tetratricopeptide (TPR) repeat protein
MKARMAIPFPQQIVCPVLIGRVPQLDALHQLIDGAIDGQRQAVLISGETGVGKSRLVAEAKAYAATRGFLLLQGACFPQDSACPYAPLLDLLRARFAGYPWAAIAADVEPFAADLAPLLPDIIPLSTQQRALPAVDFEQKQRRLFNALAHSIVGRVPLRLTMLIVEDLHWADEGSLDFLLYLIRHSAGQQLLLIGTYRSDEIGPQLSRWLAQLDREHPSPELALVPLTRDEVAAMVRAIFALPRPVRAEFLDAINTLSEGNPFAIEELLKTLVATGDIFYADGAWERKPMHELRIPRSRREAVQQRVIRLSAEAQRLLTLAAVVGRRFDFALLQHLAAVDEDELLRLIKEFIGAQLVVEESVDQFAFRHALTRQAIYAELLARERVALHRSIAETIERTYREALEPQAADLAYHFFEAGMWERALIYARRAGARAHELNAPYAAIEHYTRALDAANKLSVVSEPSLYLARGHAYETVGDFQRAQEDYERGIDQARAVGDGTAEWHGLSALGQLWAGRDYARAGDWYRRALDRSLTLDDPKLRAHSLNRLGNWLINIGQTPEGLQAHHEALTLFQVEHDRQGMAETRDLLGMASSIAGDLVSGAQHSQAAIELLRALHDQRNLSSSLAVHAIVTSPGHAETTMNVSGTFESCTTSATEALYLARQLDWRAGQSFAEWQLGLAAAGFGQFGAALAHATEALRIAQEIEHQQWIAGAYFTLGAAYVRMLAPEAALESLLAALPLAHTLGSAWWIGNITSYLALAYLQKHDFARAEAVLAEVLPLDTVRARHLHNLSERRMAWVWGELALAQGAPEEALRIAERLIESAQVVTDGRSIPPLLKLQGEALLNLHSLDAAAQVLMEARHGAEIRGERPFLWQVLRVLGQTHQRLGRRKLAHQMFAAARDLIETLAVTIDHVGLREQFVRTAQASLPLPRPPTAERSEAARFGGLSARERNVARQIAQGKSNQEIADALVVSKRTIETHIGSILAKLRVTTRTQIAVWALEAGLLDASE